MASQRIFANELGLHLHTTFEAGDHQILWKVSREDQRSRDRVPRHLDDPPPTKFVLSVVDGP